MNTRVKFLLSIFLAFLLLVGCDSTSVNNPDDNNTNQKDEDDNDNNNNDDNNDNDNVTYPIKANDEFNAVYTETISNLQSMDSITIGIQYGGKIDNQYNLSTFTKMSIKDNLIKVNSNIGVNFIYSNMYDYNEESEFYIQVEEEHQYLYLSLEDNEGNPYYVKQTLLQSTFYQDYNPDEYKSIFDLDTENFDFYQTTANGSEFKFSYNLFNNREIFPEVFDMLSLYVEDIEYLKNDKMIDVYFLFDTELKTLRSVRFDFKSFLNDYNKSYPVYTDQALKLENLRFKYIFSDFNDVTLIDIENENVIEDQPDLPLEETYLFNINKIGDNFEGIIDYEGDMDYFKLQIDNTGKYYFDLSTDDSIFLDIYDENGVPVKDFYFQENDGSYIHQDFAVHLNEGVYYIEVMPLDLTLKQSAYSFTVEEIETDDIGDTFEEGTYKNITESGTYNGSIDYIGDIDVYNLDLYSDGIAVIKVVTENDLVIMFHRPLNDGTYEDVIMRPSDNKMTLNYYVSLDRGGYFAISSDSFVGDYSVEIEVYDDLSDLPNNETSDLPIYQPGDTIEDAKHNFSDGYDYFKINVIEDGKYRIDFSSRYIFRKNMDYNLCIYDMDGDQVMNISTSFWEYNLEHIFFIDLTSGEYIVKIELEKIDLFSFKYNLVVDDNIVPQNIDLENIEQLDISIDYLTDVDEYYFTITEEMYYTFINNSRITMSIYDEIGNKLQSSYNEQSYYFKPGNYTIKFACNWSRVATILIEKDLNIHDDYNYKNSEDDTYIGELVLGNNLISLDYNRDKDSFKIIIPNNGYYRIEATIGMDIYYYYNFENKIEIHSRDTIFLEAGIYYFDCVERNGHSSEMSLIIKEVFDDYTDPVTIDISNESDKIINGSIEMRDDEDIFKFHIESEVCYKFNSIINFVYTGDIYETSHHMTLYTDDGELLNNSRYYFQSSEPITSIEYCFQPGDYYLKISDIYLYDYEITVSEIPNIEDDYSNILSDDENIFGVLTLGDNPLNFEYNQDEDIYVLYLNESGRYAFSFNTSFLEIFNENHEIINFYWDDNVNYVKGKYIDLDAGKYYLRLEGMAEGDYNLTISKS